MKNSIKINKFSGLTTVLIVTINGLVSMKTIKSLYSYYKIIIVENNNDKILRKKLEKKFKKINFINTKNNLGFSGGNNCGLIKIKTPYVLLLGPDAEISKINLDKFENYSKKIKNFSILTANIENFDAMMNTRLDKVAMFKKFRLSNKEIQEIPWVPEWCMFCKMNDLKKINYFDDSYFLYFEGLDLCKRLKKINKTFYLLKNIYVKHQFAGTSKNLSEHKRLDHWKFRFWHFYWSSFYYHRKHYGYIRSFLIHITKLFRFFFKKNYLYFFGKNEYDYITTKAKFDGILSQVFNKKSYLRIKL